MQTAHLLSLQVGKITEYASSEYKPPTWKTAFHKQPVAGPQWVGSEGLKHDEQADRKNHGGADKALLAYCAEHYSLWQTELPETFTAATMQPGSFGENLFLSGISEATVCLGDVWQIGEVLLEVSQPRQPCWKLARRWHDKELPALVINNGRSGWYFRVLREGWLEANVTCTLQTRVQSNWSLARLNQAMYHDKQNLALALEISQLPELAASWRKAFAERAEHLKQ